MRGNEEVDAWDRPLDIWPPPLPITTLLFFFLICALYREQLPHIALVFGLGYVLGFAQAVNALEGEED